MRPTHPPAPITGLAALLCAVTLVLPGCRHHSTQSTLVKTSTRPALRGADRGLELWSWAVSDARLQPPLDPTTQAPRLLVRDDKTDIESLLAPYLGRPVPIAEEMRQRWQASGLRIIAAPAAHSWPRSVGSRRVGPARRKWLGEPTAWADAVPVARLGEPRPATLAGGTTELEPGRLRLLIRAWVVPIEQDQGTPRAGLHVELAPRLDPVIDRRDRMMAVASGQDQPGPRAFASLACSMTTASDDALVVIPDAPDADWARPAAPESDPEGYGPQTPRIVSLGELMLSHPGSRTTVRTRALIALVPHTPAKLELLPP